MKLYVHAKSKKALNERLAAGESIIGENHASHFGGEPLYELDVDVPNGTTIAIFDKTVGGTPVAKSWGTWNATKLRVE